MGGAVRGVEVVRCYLPLRRAETEGRWGDGGEEGGGGEGAELGGGVVIIIDK